LYGCFLQSERCFAGNISPVDVRNRQPDRSSRLLRDGTTTVVDITPIIKKATRVNIIILILVMIDDGCGVGTARSMFVDSITAGVFDRPPDTRVIPLIHPCPGTECRWKTHKIQNTIFTGKLAGMLSVLYSTQTSQIFSVRVWILFKSWGQETESESWKVRLESDLNPLPN